MLDNAIQDLHPARPDDAAATAKAAENFGLVPVLLSLSKSMRALHGIKLAPLGFMNGQDELLIGIPDAGLAVNELADLLTVRPSTVSKMTDRLIEKGYVQRVPDPRDGRRTIIRITEEGCEAREKVIKARNELDDELSKALDGESLDSLRASLADCANLVSKRLTRLR